MRPRPIRVYTQDLELLWQFESQTGAARVLGVGHGNIAISCNPPKAMYLGLHWRKVDDDELYEKADTSHPDLEHLKILCKTSRHGRPRCKVLQYTLDGEFVAEYVSAAVAAKTLGNVPRSGIAECCKGTQHQCGGFRWEYAENDDEAKQLKADATSTRYIDGFEGQELDGEVWKTIDICDKYGIKPYQVSSFGRVRKLGRFNSNGVYEPAKLVGQMPDKNGALTVKLSNGVCGCSRLYVSRLVALAFVPNGQPMDTVRHLDGDNTNNRADNLSWCSVIDMMTERRMLEKATKHNSRPLRQYSVDGQLIAEYDSAEDAKRKTGFSADNIRWGCDRLPKKGIASGFIWRYIDNDDLYELDSEARKAVISLLTRKG